jgi:hypothetical protein
LIPALHHLIGVKEKTETLPPGFPKREFSLAKPDLDWKLRIVRVQDDTQPGRQSRASRTLDRKRPLEHSQKGFGESHQSTLSCEPRQEKPENPLADDPQKIPSTEQALQTLGHSLE